MPVQLDKRHKIILGAGAAMLILFLLYRHYQGSAQTGQAATGLTDTTGLGGDQGAALGGQEQADVAGLQGSISDLGSTQAAALQGLAGTEQSDVQALQAALGDLGAQETTDIAGVTAGYQDNINQAQQNIASQFSDSFTGINNQFGSQQHELTQLAMGIRKLNRRIRRLQSRQAKHADRTHKAGRPDGGGRGRRHRVRHTGYHTHTRQVPHTRKVNKGTHSHPRWVTERYTTTETFKTPYTYWTNG